MFTRIRRFFRPEAKPEETKQVKAPSSGLPRPTDREIINNVVLRNIQCTNAHFVPCQQEGYSMDADIEAVRGLPDIYGVSTGLPMEVMGFVAGLGFIGYQMCALLAQHWIIGKACSKPARAAVQHGYEVALPGGGENAALALESIKTLDKKMDVLGHCREFVRWARVFGIRHALFVVDGIDYELPFNIDGVAPYSYKGISQIDPYWLTPELDFSTLADPADMNFYEPTYWRLPGGKRIHRSHFAILRTEEVADVLKPTYRYGGIPLPQAIVQRVYAAERTANEAPELALTKRTTTIQGNIDNYLSDELEFTERLQAFARMRDSYGFLVLSEEETMTQTDTSLADFDALIMTQYQLVAAIAGVPATELLETSPKGFNATGEHEIKSYKSVVASIQTNDMSPLIERHHALLVRSHIVPGLGQGEYAVTHAWNEDKPTPTELAELNNKKAATGQLLVTAGAISPDEERARIAADPASGYTGLAAPEGAEEEEDADAVADLLTSIGGGNE